MTLIQPAIGLIDAGIGHVRQIATGFDQVGLTIDIAPDNPHLLAGALTTQCAAQFVIAGCGLRGSSNLPAQLAGGEGAVQLTRAHQFEQHQRVTQRLFYKEVAGRTDPAERRPALGRPVIEPVPALKPGDCRAPRLLGTAGQWL